MAWDADHGELFDRALVLRDSGNSREAIALLGHLVTLLDPVASPRAMSHSLVQIAGMHYAMAELVEAEAAFRRATEVAPRFELASLGLFLALWNAGRPRAAMAELQRYVDLKPNSAGYRELLEGGYSFADPDLQALAESAHEKLLRFE